MQELRVFKNPDEALRNYDRRNARSMLMSLELRAPLQRRMLATAELPWHIEPEDAKNPEQKQVAKELTTIIEAIPDFLKLKNYLLWSIWFGKTAVQLRYEWDFSKGYKRCIPTYWAPCHGDTITFHYSGQMGILINPSQIPGVTKPLTYSPTDITVAHFLEPNEREAFILQKHEILAGDFFDPDSQGSAMHGIGLRSVLYWTWYQVSEAKKWLMSHLEEIAAGGLTIYFYDQANPQSEAKVRELANAQSFENRILWPMPLSTGQTYDPIQRIEASSTGVQNLLQVIDEYFGRQFKEYIEGQSLTSEAHGTGLGSGVADAHEETFHKIVRYDAINLQECLTRDLLDVLVKYNYPELPFKLRFKIAVDRPEPKEFMESVKLAFDMGLALDAEEVYANLGLSKPDANSEILQKQAEHIAEDKADTLDAILAPDETPEATDETPVAQDIDDKSANELRATVGGSQALADLQRAVYAGELPREAAIANARIVFGFSPEEADALFPLVKPVKTADEPAPQPVQQQKKPRRKNANPV